MNGFLQFPSLRQAGFNLTELMVAVAIVAIVAGIGYPSYQTSAKNAQRDVAKGGLVLLASEMQRRKTTSATNNFANLANEDGTPISTLFPSQLPLDTDTKTYDLTVSISDDGSQYTLTATPIEGSSMEGDGVYTLASTGAKTWKGSSGWEH